MHPLQRNFLQGAPNAPLSFLYALNPMERSAVDFSVAVEQDATRREPPVSEPTRLWQQGSRYCRRSRMPPYTLKATHFPLPTLVGPQHRERSMVLHNENPFFMIRGLKPLWFSKRKNVVIYLGIASYVATKRALTNGDATALHHVTNIEPFYNDFGEIVSFYSLSRPAASSNFFLADINDIVKQIKDCGYEERPLLFDTPSNGMVI
ncbi:hypothetical protein B0T26DRAFT_679193 [Lasiosphaeria miniovina]|uniref:Uncharacterized protein n=1 Tax=Lasiosphaeria miniovina TaxID=1954250 RepID=A0AA40A5W7_9PEZI|nr:uncharacterized protein B0T26DRAFT_679193 [Lasiosphaeria miniovina]KAK0709827.1 hypothetical protein B0T26DRAFT_679193 [Lasiosphaeria miniovina]